MSTAETKTREQICALGAKLAARGLPSVLVVRARLRMDRGEPAAIGAALDVSSPVGIPAHFTLFVPADGRHWPCRVIWRKERRIGVAFE